MRLKGHYLGMLGLLSGRLDAYHRRVVQEEIQKEIEPLKAHTQAELPPQESVRSTSKGEILAVVAAYSQAHHQVWFSRMCVVSGGVTGFFLHAVHVGRLPLRIGAIPIAATAVYMASLWNKSHSTAPSRRAALLLEEELQ